MKSKRRLRVLKERLLYRYDQMSLQTRLIHAYILIMLIPSILVSLYLFRNTTGNYILDIQKKNENAIEIENINISNNIETMVRTAQLTVDDRVKGYLSRTVAPDTSELIAFDEETVTSITRLQYNNPNIEHIRLFSDNKRINELYPVFWEERRIEGEPWHGVVNALDGTDFWQFSMNDRDLFQYSTQARSEADRPKLSLLREIEYPAGTHIGMLEIDMLLQNFFPKTYGSVSDDQSQMVIADREGNLFYNGRQSLLARDGITPAILKAQLKLDTRGPMESFRFTLAGKPFLGTYSEIGPLDAHIVSLVSLEQVLMDMNRTRNAIIAANVMLMVLLSIATYFLNALILKRLRILTDSMKKVRQGVFNFDIPIKGGGEAGELAHHFRKMLRKINELIADAVNKQAATKETELRSLKNQIDSHFLYNTLENIKMMAEVEGQLDISDALTSLGGLLRYNLQWTSEYVKLRDEIGHIVNYIAVMNVRFEQRVRLTADIPELFLEQELLKLSLQPVVENAVKHGFRASSGDELAIVIRAGLTDGVMTISVTDNGCGMTAEAAAELNRRLGADEPERRLADGGHTAPGGGHRENGSGIGLRNVHQRIQLYYGKDYGIGIESAHGAYTRVSIRIPYLILTGGAA